MPVYILTSLLAMILSICTAHATIGMRYFSDTPDAVISASKWEHRVVLLFANELPSDEVNRQLDMLDTDQAGMSERDIVILSLNRQTASHRTLFERYNIDSDFTLVLIGKDGGEKLRRQSPIPGALLYQTIDAMPMRQQEMLMRGDVFN